MNGEMGLNRESSVLLNFPDKLQQLQKFIDKSKNSCRPDRTRGVLIECLHKAQELFSYIPRELQVYVGKELNLSHADVYGVISFYSFFNDHPVGRYQINICT
ncbi:MAG: NAD(P)H-dependent oxidoreductase subunit E, partial [Lentisphaeria bacterium]|nr:NAD(P)H-dependent oxidoreductase subunit E [Lentisphaeria bacterium]